MKKFIGFLTEFKTWLCLCFTASMVIYTVCCLLFGNETIECKTVFQLLGIAAGITLLQYLCFTEVIFKKLRYSLRMLIFLAPTMGLLSLFAVVFYWFPVDRLGAWAVFLLAAFLIFAAISAGFEIYFWAAGKKYDGLLGEYRKKGQKKS